MLDDALVAGVERPSGQRTVAREGLQQAGGSSLSFVPRFSQRRVRGNSPRAACRQPYPYQDHRDGRESHGVALRSGPSRAQKTPFRPLMTKRTSLSLPCRTRKDAVVFSSAYFGTSASIAKPPPPVKARKGVEGKKRGRESLLRKDSRPLFLVFSWLTTPCKLSLALRPGWPRWRRARR